MKKLERRWKVLLVTGAAVFMAFLDVTIVNVAAATGPSLGGVLIEWTDWRLVFFVNLAIGGAALIPARRLLHEIRDPDRGAVPDLLGIVLLAGSIGLLSLGIVQAPDWGW